MIIIILLYIHTLTNKHVHTDRQMHWQTYIQTDRQTQDNSLLLAHLAVLNSLILSHPTVYGVKSADLVSHVHPFQLILVPPNQ